jgi:hypothetical protein
MSAGILRRVRDRIALAWEESGISGAQVPENPYAADAGETLFVPRRLAPDSRFPATVRHPTVESIERRLAAPAGRIRLVAGRWLPAESADVEAFAERVAGWAGILSPGEWLFCVQALSDRVLFAPEEFEQLLGLAAHVAFVDETEMLDGTRCLVAAGTVRERACAVALNWPVDLVTAAMRLAPALERLALMSDVVRAGIHIVECPAGATAQWRDGAERLLQRLAANPRAVFGARVADRDTDISPLLEILARVTDGRARLKVQWLDRIAEGAAPAPIMAGVTCDCSLDAAAQDGPRPYVTDAPYVPMHFDVRVPSQTVRPGALAEIARIDGAGIPALDERGWKRLTTSPGRASGRAFRRLIDAPVEERCRRLRQALDFTRRRDYLRALELNPREVSRWHHFHVYNWPPPPARILRLVCYGAADLTRRVSALRALQDLELGDTILTGDAFVAAVDATVDRGARSGADLRGQQVTAHGYLADGGRRELTADSEQLVSRLPASLGSTLEIGFGYGLTARRVAGRATRYVGIDLQTAQGRALRAAGGLGVVGDIHALPLRSGLFDTVIADNVLEHAAKPVDALREMRRTMRPGARAYVLIPLDAATSEFQIRTHLWKADESSIRRAAGLADLDVVDLQVLTYETLGVYGCFPASGGRTCLVVFERLLADGEDAEACSQYGVRCAES